MGRRGLEEISGHRNESCLKELLAYNREDVFMLRRIEEALDKRNRKSGAEKPGIGKKLSALSYQPPAFSLYPESQRSVVSIDTRHHFL